MAFSNGDRVKITSGENAGLMATVLAPEGGGRVPVFVDTKLVVRGYVPSSLAPLTVPAPTPTETRKLIWSDEFDGSAMDTSKWGLYDGPGHGGNGLRDPKTWTVQTVAGASGAGKAAVCTAYWDAAAQKVHAGGASARGGGAKFGYFYGRIEARAKFDPDPSGRMSGLVLTWPIGWGGTEKGVKPTNETRRINLVYGELDLAESLRNTDAHRRPMYAFMHWPDVQSGSEQTRWVADVAGDEWHTYALDWYKDRLVWYVDGIERGRETDPAKIPSIPFTPCLQLDCFENAPIGTQRAYYDYVRVYAA